MLSVFTQSGCIIFTLFTCSPHEGYGTIFALLLLHCGPWLRGLKLTYFRNDLKPGFYEECLFVLLFRNHRLLFGQLPSTALFSFPQEISHLTLGS